MGIFMSRSINNELKERILILDGAMGTMLQEYKLSEEDFRGKLNITKDVQLKGNNDILSLTRPEIIREIHEKYLEAGCNIIETNTLNSNKISQADYGMEEYVYEMNKTSAAIAREAASKYSSVVPHQPRYVAGSIGPTNRSASLPPDISNPGRRSVSFDELVEAYEEQINGLIDGGADLLLIETIIDALNARAAMVAAENVFNKKNVILPIMISATVAGKSGRILSGQTLEAFANSMKHDAVISIGLNCSFGAKELIPFVKELAKTTEYAVSVYPNAGFRNALGQFDEGPEDTAAALRELIDGGYVNIVGGCCGTTPEHIREIVKICSGKKPRSLPQRSHRTVVCGLEPLYIEKSNNFINAGERTNVAGSKKFARLIAEKKYDEALQIARGQVENGAQIIDINVDDGMLNIKHEMEHFLRLIAAEPDISRVPVMIDSSHWEVLHAGLKCLQGKHIVNSLSLKEGEDEFVHKAGIIKQFGAALVVMAFDEKGQADTFARKIEICKRAYDILTGKVGFPAEDIIFDPNILAIGTGIEEHRSYALDYIEAVRWIKSNLPHAKVSGGISNLSFAFRGNDTIREILHSVFLYHAIEAGMDMGILNPAAVRIYEDIPKAILTAAEDLVLNKRSDAVELLLEHAESISTEKHVEADVDRSSQVSPEQAIINSIIRGNTEGLEVGLQNAISSYDSIIELVETTLMEGMKRVGELFEQGKMFLPQVIKSARVMKSAIEILRPYMESGSELSKKGSIVLATVKGDVHDIGKNIVGAVLECNNISVIDMGIMVDAETIIEKAKEAKPDFIGLSALITPSLEEMCKVAELMEAEGLRIPLLIGGAAASKVYTAVKLEPLYSGSVVYVSDASKGVEVCNRLLDPNAGAAYIKNIKEEYRRLKEAYYGAEKRFLSLEEARKHGCKADFSRIVKPRMLGVRVLENYDLQDTAKHIDWTYLLTALELRKKYPEILEDTKYKEQAAILLSEAEAVLEKLIEHNGVRLDGVFAIYPANSEGDDIIVYKSEDRSEASTTLNMLRRQEVSGDRACPCIADFIAPAREGGADYISAFTVTARLDESVLASVFKGDSYKLILARLIADRLAEAFAEKLHKGIAYDYWGFANTGDSEGIRPAIGYPAIPDHSEKLKLDKMLNFTGAIGIKLTESYMMQPVSSVCGLILANPEARNIDVGNILEDQLQDYAERKQLSLEAARSLLNDRVFER